MENRLSIKRRRCRSIEACYTCKRRKEKCDGNKPCARCIYRRVASSCEFRQRLPSKVSTNGDNPGISSSKPHEPVDQRPVNQANPIQGQSPCTTSDTHKSPDEQTASLSQTFQGTDVTTLGPGSATDLSWLHGIHRLVHASIGSCEFVEKLSQIQIPESVTSGPTSWLHNVDKYPLAKPTFEEGAYLIRWYESTCACGIDLFEENELLSELQSWLRSPSDHVSSRDAIYFLVFAIGAQICPKDENALANLYFDYGRYLTASYLSESLSIATVQAHCLIAVYALGGAHSTAAYMSLGAALRSVYALRLHLPDTMEALSIRERRDWERTWKATWFLDLSLSGLLGYPPSSVDIRIDGVGNKYSASANLCAIFEKILNSIHSKQTMTAEVLQDISQHHRSWSTHFRSGLQADGIQRGEYLPDGTPNIRLLHLKQAYYWTLVLLTQSFFVESISSYVDAKASCSADVRSLDALSHSHEFLVHACINASISIVDLCTMLLESENLPRRMPFVVNSLFVSGLVLGLSCFGDLHTKYTLHENLGKVLTLINLFPKTL